MNYKKVSDCGEFGVIDLIKKNTSISSKVIQGIGDDTAILPYKRGQYLLFTTDMLIEDVHFTQNMPAGAVGHKAIACSISDIAAMGGMPTFAVVSLGVPENLDTAYIKKLYKGMQKLGKGFNVDIVGGDTVKSESIVINIALVGEVSNKHLVRRDGAKVGDKIFVTGPLGRSFVTGHHLKFIPRVKEAQQIVKKFKPTSMMDISDGLISDLGHILKLSGVGARIDEEKIPRRKKATIEQAVCDGEDFELLFTLSPKESKKCKFYEIGEIVEGKGSNLEGKGYQHF